MNVEQVEEILRRAGRPLQPPGRLQRAVLNPAGGSTPTRRRPWQTAVAAAAAALLVLIGSVAVVQQLTAFHAVAAVALQGASGSKAVAEVGQANGPNRPVQLVVQHLQPGRRSYYVVWSLAEQPPMMLTTFMTDTSGSCVLTFSMPATTSWTDFAIAPEGQNGSFLLRARR